MVTASSARTKIHIEPVYLFDIDLLADGAPSLYFSDRNINVGGVQYEDYIDNIPDIQEEVKFVNSSGLNSDINIVFKNEAYMGNDYLINLNENYPFSGAVVTVKELYVLNDGTNSDTETIFVGVLDSPGNITLDSFECGVSNKVTNIDEKYTQKLFNLSDYPKLSLTAVGRIVNTIGYGSPKKIRATAIVGGATTLLSSDITDNQTLFDAEDVSRFPTPPFIIQIEYEQMLVNAVNGNTLDVTRGYEGTAVAHARNNIIFEVKTEYIYHLFDSPISSIDDVYIDNVLQVGEYTAYTGQTGDEHPDYPGKAIISFTADAIINKQRNLTSSEALAKEAASTLTESPQTGNVNTSNLRSGYSARFTSLSRGTVRYQTYSLTLANEDENTDASFLFSVNNTETGKPINVFELKVEANGSESFDFQVDSSVWGTTISVHKIGESVDWSISNVSRTMYYTPNLGSIDADYLANSLQPADKWSHGPTAYPYVDTILNTAVPVRWVTYTDTPQEGTLAKQVHSASVYNSGSNNVAIYIAGVTADDVNTIEQYSLLAGETKTISVTQDGGGWSDRTVIGISALFVTEVVVSDITKTVYYKPTDSQLLVTEELTYGSSSEVVIGSVVVADVSLIEDDGSGTYTGTPNSIITIPSDVIRYSLINDFGFTAAEIDSTTFDAARTDHGNALLQFDFAVDFDMGQDSKRPSEFLQELAWQCGSVLRFTGSKWYLSFLPGLPPSAEKTISSDELAGRQQFLFNETERNEIRNKITAKYSRNYGKFETDAKDTNWLSVYEISLQPSIDVYGERPEVFEFWAISHEVTAKTIAEFQLSIRGTPKTIVDFDVFFENFDLQKGDTFDISNGLFNGVKFFIESIKKTNKSEAHIQAKSWMSYTGGLNLIYYGTEDSIQYFGTSENIILVEE